MNSLLIYFLSSLLGLRFTNAHHLGHHGPGNSHRNKIGNQYSLSFSAKSSSLPIL